MIERYTRKEMAEVWSLEGKYGAWLAVELAVCDALVKENLLTEKDAAFIRKNARFDVNRVAEIEAKVKHDVIAFLTNVNENLGELGRFMHYGMTSSDVLDTGFALQMTRALDLILVGVAALSDALKAQAMKHKDTVQIGRSHGVHAEPITFGIELALYYDEMRRNRERLETARKNIAVGKISGAVGTYAHLSPQVEARACQKLGLEPERVANQVIQRDRHAEVFTSIAILGGTLEKIAVEIRHLQRTEVREAEEPFTKGQKGSSAMPHKRNPIASENITGGARLLRAYAGAALEDVALWHERDISHSSVERVIAPDATILADYMLHRLAGVIKDLVVYPEQMRKNLEESRGLIYSQALLLKLVEKGLTREAAYDLVQRNAMKVWDEGGDFAALVGKDEAIVKVLGEKALKEVFDLKRYISSRDEIFSRVFERRN